MQARQHHRLRAATGRDRAPWQDARRRRWRDGPLRRLLATGGDLHLLKVARLVTAHPEHAGLAQLLGTERIGGAGVAPAHVPEVLGEHHLVVFTRSGGVVERLVELLELWLDERRQILVGGELHGAVVAAFHASVFGQDVDDQVLRFVRWRVQHAQAHRQHELFALEGELQRSQHAVTQPLLLLEVDLGHEELHAHVDVGLERGGRAFGNLVAVLAQPDFKAVGLLRRERDDVVFLQRVGSLDGHSERGVTALGHFRAHGAGGGRHRCWYCAGVHVLPPPEVHAARV